MIRNFGIAFTAVLTTTAMLSLWSIPINAQSTTSSNLSGINNTTQSTAGQVVHPKVTITSPPKNSSLPIGVVLVTGIASASPGGTAIKDVKVHVDKQAYSNATPKVTGDWSNWSIKLNISIPGPHEIQARATDIAGNQNWHHVSVNIKAANVNASTLQASTPTNATTTSNKTAMATPPTNATTTSNKTAMATPPTNATTTSNKTAMATPPTNATTTSNKTAMATPPTNATTTSNKTAMATPPTNATTTSNKTAMATPPTNATTTSNKTATTNAPTVVPSFIQHKSAFPGIIP